ncbi:Protein phosphatase 2A regulatory subunit PR55 [Carpediemonas membranifera]|uniref:Serine/threonine-protein phosphatase 2A 55 kDa regulatory subunit B n=1 Tax=Carpediemonas membranifera TaxID=201153 RepID=A0A8J6AR21_9EUKA|nr:Protein phosphatase 2A regulatory subunit PR55 [Carpediemonas membranifera]|eukprot:KAG9392101.1 Protein phosphatase 2A regulatory subunit PR55 [Carpediemonas membranifera]
MAAESFKFNQDSSWKFCQVFGDVAAIEDVKEEDLISSIEFNTTGDFLAAGDHGGRVVLFERVEKTPKSPSGTRHRHSAQYRFFTEFQSHEQEFDYLRSLEIDEKINQIRWCHPQAGAHFLLTTNDKTVKLWKVYERKSKQLASMSAAPRPAGTVQIPRLVGSKSVLSAAPKRVFNNAHAYHINSLSLSSDGVTFLSADDLRINMWSTERPETAFNVVDIRPPNLDNLVEVITAAECHPGEAATFAYGTSKGVIRLCDLRASALCDFGSKSFNESTAGQPPKSFYQEIASSISDLHFSKDGKYMFSRDFLTLKVWDVAMESRPLHTIPIHDSLKPHLPHLFEQDVIFDKFECAVSPSGSHVLTGSYNNNFHIYDRMGRGGICIEASRERATRKRGATKTPRLTKTRARGQGLIGNVDTARKILHMGWHPTEDIIAVATATNMFVYAGTRAQ